MLPGVGRSAQQTKHLRRQSSLQTTFSGSPLLVQSERSIDGIEKKNREQRVRAGLKSLRNIWRGPMCCDMVVLVFKKETRHHVRGGGSLQLFF